MAQTQLTAMGALRMAINTQLAWHQKQHASALDNMDRLMRSQRQMIERGVYYSELNMGNAAAEIARETEAVKTLMEQLEQLDTVEKMADEFAK
ncbi:hypothetical protein ACMX2H_18295 [Arthrobacter sulfonylureivorans]|uniref:hypothetical protein n=1 Tax=Arthrobacter sulfonylureivorans TaxID=2486855 RepID=UPI0039E57F81